MSQTSATNRNLITSWIENWGQMVSERMNLWSLLRQVYNFGYNTRFHATLSCCWNSVCYTVLGMLQQTESVLVEGPCQQCRVALRLEKADKVLWNILSPERDLFHNRKNGLDWYKYTCPRNFCKSTNRSYCIVYWLNGFKQEEKYTSETKKHNFSSY